MTKIKKRKKVFLHLWHKPTKTFTSYAANYATYTVSQTNRHWLGMLQLWGPPTELDSFWQIYRRKSKLPRRHLLFCFRWLMSLHYLGKHKPQKLRTQQTRNHDQIIKWLQLNHASLLVSQYLSTRSSAIAEGPRDALCQLKSCQLPRNCAETTYTTSPDQIDGMKLAI